MTDQSQRPDEAGHGVDDASENVTPSPTSETGDTEAPTAEPGHPNYEPSYSQPSYSEPDDAPSWDAPPGNSEQATAGSEPSNDWDAPATGDRGQGAPGSTEPSVSPAWDAPTSGERDPSTLEPTQPSSHGDASATGSQGQDAPAGTDPAGSPEWQVPPGGDQPDNAPRWDAPAPSDQPDVTPVGEPDLPPMTIETDDARSTDGPPAWQPVETPAPDPYGAPPTGDPIRFEDAPGAPAEEDFAADSVEVSREIQGDASATDSLGQVPSAGQNPTWPDVGSQSGTEPFGQTTPYGQPGVAPTEQSTRYAEPATGSPRDAAEPRGQVGADQYGQPSTAPYGQASADQYGQPSAAPYGQPSASPYGQPSAAPYGQHSADHYGQHSATPYGQPSADPYGQPSAGPYSQPSAGSHGQQQPYGVQDVYGRQNPTGHGAPVPYAQQNPTWNSGPTEAGRSMLTLNYWLSAFFTWIPALIFYTTEKDKNALVDEHLKENMNFALTRIIVMLVTFIPILGWIVGGIASLVLFVIAIMGALAGPDQYAQGRPYRFPFTLRLIK